MQFNNPSIFNNDRHLCISVKHAPLCLATEGSIASTSTSPPDLPPPLELTPLPSPLKLQPSNVVNSDPFDSLSSLRNHLILV
ncbi:unnamed protein product [Ambrosiozyma monospora]|uniref:Unnamed protein product n=1 Tax=Ambrosiozyma monospora TaxID=43982 RepID=A0ACB5TTX8_AMBMO|nr:unnamed protein product [Ambrosiozyma monospora]